MSRYASKTTQHLVLRIMAAVVQSPRPMTVADLAEALDTSPDLIAQCIALHLYLERKQAAVSLAPAGDYSVPGPGAVITSELLKPSRGGTMAAETAMRNALARAAD